MCVSVIQGQQSKGKDERIDAFYLFIYKLDV